MFLISGGFKQLNVPLAHRLNIPSEHVYSVELLFDSDGKELNLNSFFVILYALYDGCCNFCSFIGRYHGFNKNNLTSDSGGKTKVVQRLKDKYGFKRCAILLLVRSWVNANLSSVFLYLHFCQNFKNQNYYCI